jgi:hypothetical protein
MAGTSPAMTCDCQAIMDSVLTFLGTLVLLIPLLFFGGLLIVLIAVAVGGLVVGAPDKTIPRLAGALRSAGFGERSVNILGRVSQWMIAASLCAVLVAGYYGVVHLSCGPRGGPLYYCFFDVIDHRDRR